MRKFLKFIAAAVSVLMPATLAAIPERPYPPRLVNDFAGIFSPVQKNTLERRLSAFADSTSNQITVVTVTDLEGSSAAEYGTEIGIRWGVGSEKFDNGIVVLVKPKTAGTDGETNISVGYGLEGAIPDSYAKRIIENEMIPAFRSGDYYTGVDKACTVLMKLASGEISEYGGSPGEDMLIGLFTILFIIILVAILSKNKGGGKNNGNRGGGRKRIIDDDFTRGLIIGSLLNSGSGNCGRNSGNGYGGGFGGFGGGDFGGGGASGRW